MPRALRLVVSLALLAWIATRVPMEEALSVLRNVRAGPLIVAAVAIVVGQTLRAMRTCAFLRGGIHVRDVWPMLRMQMVAFLPGLISPAKAGELLKVELLRREWGVSLARGTGAFFAERLADVGMVGACALWGLGAIFGKTIPGAAYVALAAIALGGVGVVVVWRSGRLPATLQARLADALADVRWLPVVLTTGAYWALVVGIVWLFARAVDSSPSYISLAGTVPLSLITVLLPVSIGGFGVREGAMVLLFQHDAVGCTQAQAVGISALYDILGLGIPVLMGVGCILAGPRRE